MQCTAWYAYRSKIYFNHMQMLRLLYSCVWLCKPTIWCLRIFFFSIFFWWRWGNDHCKHAHYAFCVTGLANVRNYIVSGHPCSRQCVGTPAQCTAAIFFFQYSLFFFLFLHLFSAIILFYIFVCFTCFWSGVEVLPTQPTKSDETLFFFPHLRIIVNAVSNLVVSCFDQT